MNTQPMNNLHQTKAPWVWRLAERQAATLAAQAVPRWLQVEDGCVWVTAENAGPHAPDLWLRAGESLELPAGSAWVLQAWPQAQMSLLAPPALKPAAAWASSRAVASGLARQAPRAWWQSSWFWPWVLPAAQGQRRAVMP